MPRAKRGLRVAREPLRRPHFFSNRDPHVVETPFEFDGDALERGEADFTRSRRPARESGAGRDDRGIDIGGRARIDPTIDLAIGRVDDI